MEARCMKCKKQVDVENSEQIVMKNGKQALKGMCCICGTKVFRILPKEMYISEVNKHD